MEKRESGAQMRREEGGKDNYCPRDPRHLLRREKMDKSCDIFWVCQRLGRTKGQIVTFIPSLLFFAFPFSIVRSGNIDSRIPKRSSSVLKPFRQKKNCHLLFFASPFGKKLLPFLFLALPTPTPSSEARERGRWPGRGGGGGAGARPNDGEESFEN